jgi:hypothetical protein
MQNLTAPHYPCLPTGGEPPLRPCEQAFLRLRFPLSLPAEDPLQPVKKADTKISPQAVDGLLNKVNNT